MTDERPGFTIADVMRWKAALDRGPAAGLRDIAGTAVATMGFAANGRGMLVRFETAAGDNVDLVLNPVLALGLLTAVRQCGAAGGWLDDTGIILPPA